MTAQIVSYAVGKLFPDDFGGGGLVYKMTGLAC